MSVLESAQRAWNGASFTKKLAVVGGVATLAYLISKGTGGGVNVIPQAFYPDGRHTPWATTPLGFGTTTIGVGGCVLCSINMAWNKFNPDSPLDPIDVNDLFKQTPGAFSGSSLNTETAANGIGLLMPSNERIQDPHSGMPDAHRLTAMCAILDLSLSKGGGSLLRVDHDRDIALVGDHTLFVYGKDSSGYLAGDPALGRSITLDSRLQGSAGIGYGAHLPYQGVGVAAIYNS